MTTDILAVYDAAQRGDAMTAWHTYCGAQIGLGAEPEADGLVYVWLADAADMDDMFDTRELTPHQFLSAVAAFVRTNSD